MGAVGIDALLCASAAHFYFAAEANSISVFTDVWLPAMTIPVSWPGNVYLLAAARRECLRENRFPGFIHRLLHFDLPFKIVPSRENNCLSALGDRGTEGITGLAVGMPITIRFNPPLTEL